LISLVEIGEELIGFIVGRHPLLLTWTDQRLRERPGREETGKVTVHLKKCHPDTGMSYDAFWPARLFAYLNGNALRVFKLMCLTARDHLIRKSY
jgi:hypothetical protein